MDLSVVPFNKQSNNHYKADNESEDGDVVEPKLSKNGNKKEKLANNNSDVVRYRECMRNHAASLGGHANDGCGEFMLNSSAADGSSLTCAACGCHRNFHRRESAVSYHHSHPPLLLYNAAAAAAAAGPATPRWDHHGQHHQRMAAQQHQQPREAGSYERRSSETPEREDVATANNAAAAAMSGGSSGKRFRTKFTPDQKDRMLAFAESIGWRIQRHDDVAINQFCADIGVRRNVLKVWMHNNKNAHRRRDSDDPPPSMSAAPIPNPNPPPPQAVVGV